MLQLAMPNELVNWRRSPAGAQGTNSGHKNAEGMAAVGVHVELTVRFARRHALPDHMSCLNCGSISYLLVFDDLQCLVHLKHDDHNFTPDTCRQRSACGNKKSFDKVAECVATVTREHTSHTRNYSGK